MMKDHNDLMSVLTQHIGAKNGVTASALAAKLEISERNVRQHISTLRDEGIAVCGHPSTGYFVAANRDEIEATCRFLRNRAMHSLHLEARLRQVTLPELIGQMKLGT